MAKKYSYTFFFPFLSPSLTRGTKETWAPGAMDLPAQLTSYLPATLGINGEVKCYRATLPRMPKNVCDPHRAPSVRAPFTPHVAASGSQRAWHRGFAFQDLIEKFLWAHAFACSLSPWFSFFLYVHHNGLSTIFGCCVRVTRPTQVCVPSHKALHKEWLHLLVISNRPAVVQWFWRRCTEEVRGSTTANRAALRSLLAHVTGSQAAWDKQGKKVTLILLPAWPSSFSQGESLLSLPTGLSVSKQPPTSRSIPFSRFLCSCLLPHMQCPPGLFLQVVSEKPQPADLPNTRFASLPHPACARRGHRMWERLGALLISPTYHTLHRPVASCLPKAKTRVHPLFSYHRLLEAGALLGRRKGP